MCISNLKIYLAIRKADEWLFKGTLHSLKYDPVSAHFLTCRYCRKMIMEYESIQFIKLFAIFSFGQDLQDYL